jgi:hypothetical protein
MRRGSAGRWLVDSWVPRPGSDGASSAAPAQFGGGSVVPQIEVTQGESKISRAWLALPLALLSLSFVVPVFVLTRERVRGRRAEKAYAAESARRASSSSSSPS